MSIQQYRDALTREPDNAAILTALGSALLRECNIGLAESLAPGIMDRSRGPARMADAQAMLRELRLLIEAVKCLRRATELGGATSELHAELADALLLQGKRDEATEHFRMAAMLDPANDDILRRLSNVLLVGGFVDEALGQIRAILRARPDAAHVHSAYLLGLHYRQSSPAAVFKEHRRFDAQHTTRLGTRPAIRRRTDPARRLRVGYVSPDLRRHSVAYFFEPVLAAHSHDQFEVVCYASVGSPDAVTRRLQGLADGWREVHALSDAELVELIEHDEIDILVDLAGHTLGNRLLAFARRPAPIQVTYLGYPDTTGLSSMDYRFTDLWADPIGWNDDFHTERLVRLPRGFVCYRPPDEAPSVGPLPALDLGGITFGSFNNLCKVSLDVVECWSNILNVIAGSRLVMKASALAHAEVRRHIHELFQANGIGPDRLTLLGETAYVGDHLELYNSIDVALDPFPYNGTTTTCEALWMGVPVISLAGSTHASRVGVSLLTRAGLPELVAATRADYIGLAFQLSARRDHLAELRQGMRRRLQASALLDAAGVTASIEQAYRRMWRTWCRDVCT